MNKNLILSLLLVILSSCNNLDKNLKIIHVNSTEFKAFEANSVVKKEKAWELHVEFCKHNNSIYPGTMFFVVDNYYVFSNYFNPKIPEVLLTGVYVDATSGAVKYVVDKEKVRPQSQFGWKFE